MTKRHLRAAILAGIACAVVGCNTTPTKTPRQADSKQADPAQVAVPARIEIQEAVGFTIVEEAYIDDAVRLDYDRAHNLLNQGRVQDGIALLETVAEAAPTVSAPRIDLGIAYHREGDLEAAEKQLKQALEINPAHPVALNELGIVYRKTARFAQARQSYQAALDVYPGFHYARRNLAVLCDLYLADLECAVDNYEAYMSTVDNDEEAAMWLKNARFRSGQVE
jgi:Flp pilus assembly protein TadD